MGFVAEFKRRPEKASKKDLWPKKPESMRLVRASTQGSRSPHFFDLSALLLHPGRS